MRQKDANEAGRVIGNELRHAMPEERDGLFAAHCALLGHYRERYPDIDLNTVTGHFKAGREYGWAAPESESSSTTTTSSSV